MPQPASVARQARRAYVRAAEPAVYQQRLVRERRLKRQARYTAEVLGNRARRQQRLALIRAEMEKEEEEDAFDWTTFADLGPVYARDALDWAIAIGSPREMTFEDFRYHLFEDWNKRFHQ